jgi:hypothetical protein
MTNEEYRKLIEAMRQYREYICSDKERSRQFLIDIGVFTPDGELTEHHKPETLPE